MRSVIVDAAPRRRDALALMIAMNSPDLLVESITTVGGNATLSETTDNALRLVEHLDGMQSVVPIRRRNRPASPRLVHHAYHVHGSEGLGVRLPTPTLKAHGMGAVEFIRHRDSTSLMRLCYRDCAADQRRRCAGQSRGHGECILRGRRHGQGSRSTGQYHTLRRFQHPRRPLGR